MSMSKKDYDLIAKRFSEQIVKHPAGSPAREALKDVIGTLAASLQASNPAFQPARFVAACNAIAK